MRVLLFGMIAERAGATELELSANSVNTLRGRLREAVEGLDELVYAIAVDRRIVRDDMALTGDEEIAVLPPFAGG
jgi:molybdopterin converting factor small subunit